MYKIGEIKKGLEIGKGNQCKYIWHACIECGKERWVHVIMKTKLPYDVICRDCANKKQGKWLTENFVRENSPQWKGGRTEREGYILIRLSKDDFFYGMANNGYVSEHRLVVARALGRCLHRWEIVHHKHTKYPAGSIEDKQDNRYPENLQLVSDDRHNQITILETQIKRLKVENQALRDKLQSI